MSDTQQQITEDIEVLTIGYFQADIFDLFAQSRSPNSHLLIRVTHNRKVNYLEEKRSQNDCFSWGFLGRKGDGELGLKTIWLGLERLHYSGSHT